MSEFVPFEIAKKLKEKGFKEKCLTYYDVIDNVGLLYNTQYTNDLSPCQYTDLLQSHNTDVNTYQSDDSEYCVDAPTISQVLKWLREEKDIHVNINLSKDWEEDGNWNVCDEWVYWTYNIQKVSTGEVIFDYDDEFDAIQFQTYELAVHDAIEYILDNLI